MVIWDVSFTVAYTDGSVSELGILKDEDSLRITAGTEAEIQAAIQFPKFNDFLVSIGLGRSSVLPANVLDYSFRFSALTTNHNINALGGSDILDSEVVSDGYYSELFADESFILVFGSRPADCESFVGISVLSDEDDALTDPIDIPFAFKFYNQDVTQFRISSNGFITFNIGEDDAGCCMGLYLPNVQSPRGIVAGYWTDLVIWPLDGPKTCQIQYATLGSAPSRRMIVSYENVSLISTEANELSFQIKLFEGSNAIEIHYCSCIPGMPSDEGEGTQIITAGGIENSDGTKGIALYNSVPPPTIVNKSIRFTPNGDNYAYSGPAFPMPTDMVCSDAIVLPYDGDWHPITFTGAMWFTFTATVAGSDLMMNVDFVAEVYTGTCQHLTPATFDYYDYAHNIYMPLQTQYWIKITNVGMGEHTIKATID